MVLTFLHIPLAIRIWLLFFFLLSFVCRIQFPFWIHRRKSSNKLAFLIASLCLARLQTVVKHNNITHRFISPALFAAKEKILILMIGPVKRHEISKQYFITLCQRRFAKLPCFGLIAPTKFPCQITTNSAILDFATNLVISASISLLLDYTHE